MQIEKIHIYNFRVIKDEEFNFKDLNIIIGNNGTFNSKGEKFLVLKNFPMLQRSLFFKNS